MVTHGERIEIGIKLGKIQDVLVGNNAGNTKKSFRGHPKKKEGESGAIYPQKGKGRYQDYDHQAAAVTIPIAPPNVQHIHPGRIINKNQDSPLESLMCFQ